MFRNRMPRQVDVDWSRRRGARVPIVAARSYAFGEPGYTDRKGEAIEGTICWDPSEGWVLDAPRAALDDAPRAALDDAPHAAPEDRSRTPPDDRPRTPPEARPPTPPEDRPRLRTDTPAD